MEAVKPVVFLCDDHRAWQAEKLALLSSQPWGVGRVVHEMEREVAVAVVSAKWLSARRSCEALFVLARAGSVRVVSFEWVSASLERGALAPPHVFALREQPALESAQRGASTLLRGLVVLVSRQLPTTTATTTATAATTATATTAAAATTSSSIVNITPTAHPSLSSSAADSLRRGVALSYWDAILLALLHGATVQDIVGLPIPAHRGFSAADLPQQPPPFDGRMSQVRVLVPSTDAVSALGHSIYSSLSLRPILIDWLVVCIQKQVVEKTDRYEVYA